MASISLCFARSSIDMLTLLGDERSLSAEALLHYELNDGSKEIVQCAWFLTRDDAGLITAIRIYGNAARVFKPFIPATN